MTTRIVLVIPCIPQSLGGRFLQSAQVHTHLSVTFTGSGSTIVTFLLGINAVIEEVDYVANVTHGEIGAL